MTGSAATGPGTLSRGAASVHTAVRGEDQHAALCHNVDTTEVPAAQPADRALPPALDVDLGDLLEQRVPRRLGQRVGVDLDVGDAGRRHRAAVAEDLVDEAAADRGGRGGRGERVA